MRESLFMDRVSYFVLLLFILVGCTISPISSAGDFNSISTSPVTPDPTMAVTKNESFLHTDPPGPISSPSATAWIDPIKGRRTWVPSEILIQAGTAHMLSHDPFNIDPWFLLYSDGSLVKKECVESDCEYTISQLSIQSICRLLNSIETIGFFSYDPSTFSVPIVGGEITYIEVSAWKSNSISLFQLEDWIEDPEWLNRLLQCEGCRKPPEISASLVDTYRLLKDYSPQNANTYQPEHLAIWLTPAAFANEPIPWGLEGPSLGRLSEMSTCPDGISRRVIVLSGPEAKLVSNYINQIASSGLAPVFTEESLIFEISTRWMLPYEQAAGCGEASEKFQLLTTPDPNKFITCQISDGFFPTSTATRIP